jgi:predicted secreted protein
MNPAIAIAVYVVLWWTVLFAVLPIGVRTQGEDGNIVPGTPESAPTAPRFLRILLLTTLITSAVFGALWAAGTYGLFDFAALIGRDG